MLVILQLYICLWFVVTRMSTSGDPCLSVPRRSRSFSFFTFLLPPGPFPFGPEGCVLPKVPIPGNDHGTRGFFFLCSLAWGGRATCISCRILYTSTNRHKRRRWRRWSYRLLETADSRLRDSSRREREIQDLSTPEGEKLAVSRRFSFPAAARARQRKRWGTRLRAPDGDHLRITLSKARSLLSRCAPDFLNGFHGSLLATCAVVTEPAGLGWPDETPEELLAETLPLSC